MSQPDAAQAAALDAVIAGRLSSAQESLAAAEQARQEADRLREQAPPPAPVAQPQQAGGR
ncbi:hypothetical protein [Kitasatospora sp. NPDC096204]|uniref:hypothetical protein n=1 Tax=Kitasatospora sp. NPDC096204 TaxID=3364094 RepID=UPI0037FED883